MKKFANSSPLPRAMYIRWEPDISGVVDLLGKLSLEQNRQILSALDDKTWAIFLKALLRLHSQAKLTPEINLQAIVGILPEERFQRLQGVMTKKEFASIASIRTGNGTFSAPWRGHAMEITEMDLVNIGVKDTQGAWRLDFLFPRFKNAAACVRDYLIQQLNHPRRSQSVINRLRRPYEELKTLADHSERFAQKLSTLVQLCDEYAKVNDRLRRQLFILRLKHYSKHFWTSIKHNKPYSEVTEILISLGQSIQILREIERELPDAAHASATVLWKQKINKVLARPELQSLIRQEAFLEFASTVPRDALSKALEWMRLRNWEFLEDQSQPLDLEGWIGDSKDPEKTRRELSLLEKEFSDLWELIPPSSAERRFQTHTRFQRRGARQYKHAYLRQFADSMLQGPISEIGYNARLALMMLEDKQNVAQATAEPGVLYVENLLTPLLAQGKTPMPISVHLGGDQTALLISGSNMSGKTVRVRSLALAVYLNQCGLPIPAEYSELSIFNHIYTVFPNVRQFKQGLGYFEMLLKELVALGRKAKPGDLVILDEVPVGTDYEELVAIATVLIESIIKTGATVAVTGHLKKCFELLQQRTGHQPYRQIVEYQDGEMSRVGIEKGIAWQSQAIELMHAAGFSPPIVQAARDFYRAIKGGTEDESILRDITLKKTSNPSPTQDTFSHTLQNVVEVLYSRFMRNEAMAALSGLITGKRQSPSTFEALEGIQSNTVEDRLRLTDLLISQGNGYLQKLSNAINNFFDLQRRRKMHATPSYEERIEYDQALTLEELSWERECMIDLLAAMEPLRGSSAGRAIATFEKAALRLKELHGKYTEVTTPEPGDVTRLRLHQEYVQEWLAGKQLIQSRLTLLKEYVGIARTIIAYQLNQPTFSEEPRTFLMEESRPYNFMRQDSDTWMKDPFLYEGVMQSLSVDPHRPLAVVTGPNSSGKTHAELMIAVDGVLAQLGFYTSGRVKTSRFDQILTYFGGENDTASGESYFMHILRQWASLIQQATSKSMIILDEMQGSDHFEIAAIQLAVLQALHEKGAIVWLNTHIRDGLRQAGDIMGLAFWKTDVDFDEETGLKYHYTLSPDPRLEARSLAMPVAKKWLTSEQYDEAKEILRELRNEPRHHAKLAFRGTSA